MPDRLYISWRHPPKLVDRILAHWAELWWAALGVVLGLLVFIRDFAPGVEIYAFVNHLSPLAGQGGAALMVLGGLVWLYSAIRKFRTINRYYFLVRTGLALSAGGWLLYFIPTVIFSPGAALIWIFSGVAFICIFGMYARTFVNERRIRGRNGP